MSEASDPHIVHHNVMLLRVADPVDLERALKEPRVRALIWHRLDPHSALVDPEAVEPLGRALRALGMRPLFASRPEDLPGREGEQ